MAAGDGPLRGVTIAALIFSAISLVTFFLGVYPGIAGVVGIIATVSMLVVQGRPGQGQRTSYQVVAGLLIAAGVLARHRCRALHFSLGRRVRRR